MTLRTLTPLLVATLLPACAVSPADPCLSTSAAGVGAQSGLDAPCDATRDDPAGAAPSAQAGQASCEAAQELDRYQLLRRLSLDLRGHLPTYEEYLALDELEALPADTADTFMQSGGFKAQMRVMHERLLWPNPADAKLADTNTRLTATRAQVDGQTVSVYTLRNTVRRRAYRGDEEVVCGAFAQVDYDEQGHVVAEITYDEVSGEPLYRKEGYVRVSPYWAPDTQIYVCAFDAQAAAVGVQGAACDTTDAFVDAGCGCGPDLRWCSGPGVEGQLLEDMREQFNRSVDAVTVGGEPYSSLLTSATEHMNGRLAYWKKYQAHLTNINTAVNGQGPGDPALPEKVDYTSTDWAAYERDGLHSGVLTLPAYTLRFNTDRARANRFRIAFTGQYFVPPAQPEDPATADCEAVADDLTQMCTCRGCHQVLEPLAAYYGEVIDAGSRIMTDLPTYDARCDPAEYTDPERQMPRSCTRLYEVHREAQNPGWRLSHQFAYVEDPGFDTTGLDDTLHRTIAQHLLEGPRGLAEDVIFSGQLANATVKHAFEFLVGRQMNLDPSDDSNELALLSELADTFEAEDDLQGLVRRIVALPQYRRIR